jgi:hypothetical protein
MAKGWTREDQARIERRTGHFYTTDKNKKTTPESSR